MGECQPFCGLVYLNALRMKFVLIKNAFQSAKQTKIASVKLAFANKRDIAPSNVVY